MATFWFILLLLGSGVRADECTDETTEKGCADVVDCETMGDGDIICNPACSWCERPQGNTTVMKCLYQTTCATNDGLTDVDWFLITFGTLLFIVCLAFCCRNRCRRCPSATVDTTPPTDYERMV